MALSIVIAILLVILVAVLPILDQTAKTVCYVLIVLGLIVFNGAGLLR